MWLVNSESVLYMFWICFEYVLNLFWICFGCDWPIVNLFWIYFESDWSIVNLFWICFDVIGQYWKCFECVLSLLEYVFNVPYHLNLFWENNWPISSRICFQNVFKVTLALSWQNFSKYLLQQQIKYCLQTQISEKSVLRTNGVITYWVGSCAYWKSILLKASFRIILLVALRIYLFVNIGGLKKDRLFVGIGGVLELKLSLHGFS